MSRTGSNRSPAADLPDVDVAVAELPDAAFAVALARLPGVGPATLRRLLAGAPARECFERLRAGRPPRLVAVPAERPRSGVPATSGSARAVSAEDLAAAARGLDVAAGWRLLARAGIAVLFPGDAGFPARLADDDEPPALLFSLGRLTADELPAAAVIGTRSCTRYGEEVAGELAAGLAAAGVVVVSGLAAGIDAAAHTGALAAGPAAAPPLAVVGGGVDVVYPPQHRSLWRAVAARGAVLSEAPPGCRPAAWRFPQRNRLLAAASDLVLVVESHRRGGSLLTVEAATRRQVAVGAVPGSVRSRASQGCNDLLADGAHVVRDLDDALVLLGMARRAAPPAAPDSARGGGPTTPSAGHDAVVLRALEDRPVVLGEVLERTGLSLLEAAATLERLLAAGAVRRAGAGWELDR